MDGSRPLRIALLSYRAHPHVGGQGVYVYYLSRALARLGHSVEVFAGQPYPEVDEEVVLRKVPSLDLYRDDDPFRRPKRHEFRDAIDVLEYGVMCTGAFPEPLTFSLRVARALKQNGAFDVVHDNQCLGYGLLPLRRRVPVVSTVHHPISVDRKLALAHAADGKERVKASRWYSFTKMQGRVARRLDRLITVSDAAKSDVIREFSAEPSRVSVVHNGVDAELFRPVESVRRVGGRLIAVTNASQPLKGAAFLIEALAKLRTERDVHLVVVGKSGDGALLAREAKRFGVERAVEVHERVDALTLVELFASAEVAVVPSLYEGFSLPAVEAMSCGVALVTTTGGALPEVVGDHDAAALLVPPADAGALADAIGTLLDDPDRRERLGDAGRRRVLERFTWESAAAATVDGYRSAIRC